MSKTRELKDKLRRIGQIKTETAAEEIREHLTRSPGARVEMTILHSEAQLLAFAPPESADDDEADTWRRVRRHLRSLAS